MLSHTATAFQSNSAPIADDSTSGVEAVSRALRVLNCFAPDATTLSLAQLSRQVNLHKTTTLRLARTLAAQGYLVQTDTGQWRLGPSAGWLGACYQATFDINHLLESTLRELTQTTRETAVFYVREGDVRLCVFRVDGPHTVRHHVRVGQKFPLDRGAAGRVILAYGGESGAAYDRVRAQGHAISIGERETGVVSAAAPVFGARRALVGAVCIAGPESRLLRAVIASHVPAVMTASYRLSRVFAEAAHTRPTTTFDNNSWWPLVTASETAPASILTAAYSSIQTARAKRPRKLLGT